MEHGVRSTENGGTCSGCFGVRGQAALELALPGGSTLHTVHNLESGLQVLIFPGKIAYRIQIQESTSIKSLQASGQEIAFNYLPRNYN